MCFDDSTSDSAVTQRHFVFPLGRDEAFIYTTFSRKTRPEPWAKISRGLF